MNENQAGSSSLLDTTDCLEAIGVFRGWKNFFFIIVVLCLLLLQASFWVVNTGHIPAKECPGSQAVAVGGGLSEDVQDVGEAAKKVAAEQSEPADAETGDSLFGITFKHLAMGIRVTNAILVLAGLLYCLTILLSLKVSLVGRLGGMNHISRAFFLSLLMLVLLLPWQRVFGSAVTGVIFTPEELVKWYSGRTEDILDVALYYLRFSGYGVLMLLLLILSQLRGVRWAKAILRRLEII